MSDSPAVILYDAAGNPVLVKAGDTVVPASQSYVPILGLDGTTARPIAVDSSGRTKMQADALPLPSGAATETTLASRATEATVATLATETKLEAVRALLATIDADTGALAAVDYATQTTLASLLSAFSAEDFASETTLAALKTAFDARDLATQTTLAALLSAFNAEDFASETTLAAAKAVLDTIDAVLDSIKDVDGIKKITDQLPVGSNLIGKVQIRNPANDGDLGDTSNPFVTDSVGNYTTSGSINAVNGFVEIDTYGSAMITAELTGTWVGTVVGEYTLDGTTWYSLVGFQIGGSAVVTSASGNGNFRANVAGFLKMRIRASAWTSGTVDIELRSHVRTPAIPIDGNGNIGVRVVATAPPAGVDAVIISADTPLTTGTHDTDYVIPNGETFYLQQITGGNEDPSKGAKIEVLYYDGTTEHLVSRDYFNGATHSSTFPDVKFARDGTEMVGDGSTKLIRVRRSKYAGSDIAIDGVVFGYTQ